MQKSYPIPNLFFLNARESAYAILICSLIFSGTNLRAEPISFQKLLQIKTIEQVEISPDGTHVAYTQREVDFEKDVYIQTVWIVSSDGTDKKHIGMGSNPSWSPDSQEIAYVAANSKQQRLLRVAISGGEPEEIYRTEGRILQVSWSPDGHKLAFLSSQGARQGSAPLVVDDNDLERLRLYVVDFDTARTTAVSPEKLSASGYDRWFFVDGFSWSPDAQSLVYGVRPSANRPGAYRYSDIMTVRADGTDLEYLVQREGMDGNPKFSPSGGYVAFIHAPMDWVRISDLDLLSLDSGRIESLSQSFDEYIRNQSWSANGSQILFTAGQGVNENLYVLDVKTKAISQLNKVEGVYSQLSVSRSSNYAAFVFQDSSTSPQIYFASLDDFKPRKLTDINPQLSSWSIGKSEVIRWKSFDGMEIEGLVHLPIGYEPGQQYPLIVNPHGGPQIADVKGFLPAGRKSSSYAMTTRGWIVFQPNFRGSSNYGEKFLRGNIGAFAHGAFYDVMSGVDYLIARGIVDPNRMAMVGHSYGGYMTAWTVTQTNRFKAAVVGAGLTNLFSMQGTSDVPSKLESYMGQDSSRLLAHSPISYIKNTSTPTLIWHGESDQRVHVSQSYEFYSALKRQNVPTQFVVYPGQGHGITKPSFQLDLFERQLAWLIQWLVTNRQDFETQD